MAIYRWNGTILRKDEGLAIDVRCCCNDCICICYNANFVLAPPFDEDDIAAVLAAVKAQSWFKKWEWVCTGVCRTYDITYQLLLAKVTVVFKCCLDQYELSLITSQDDDPCLALGLSNDVNDFANDNGLGLEDVGAFVCDEDDIELALIRNCGEAAVDPSFGVWTKDECRTIDCDYPAT